MTRFLFEPSAFMVQVSNDPGDNRSLIYAIFFPSGEKTGSVSMWPSEVRRVTPLPSMFTLKMLVGFGVS